MRISLGTVLRTLMRYRRCTTRLKRIRLLEPVASPGSSALRAGGWEASVFADGAIGLLRFDKARVRE